jgi:hypothetical protein
VVADFPANLQDAVKVVLPALNDGSPTVGDENAKRVRSNPSIFVNIGFLQERMIGINQDA